MGRSPSRHSGHLAVGGSDIYYSVVPRPNVQKRVKLSKVIVKKAALSVCRDDQSPQGLQRRAFLCQRIPCHLLAPIQEGYEWQYIYIGELDLAQGIPSRHCLIAITIGASSKQLRG